MNIKLGKKFILGEQSQSSPMNQQVKTPNCRGVLKSVQSSDQNGMHSYRQQSNEPQSQTSSLLISSNNSMPVRDQIQKLECILNEIENDLITSKQDMEIIRNNLTNMNKQYDDAFDNMVEDYSQMIRNKGEEISNIQDQLNNMTEIQLNDVLALRNEYNILVNSSKTLDLRTNVIENDVGFKVVYHF